MIGSAFGAGTRTAVLRITTARRSSSTISGGNCGEPIDYDLPYLDPWEYVVDHVIPLIRGGEDVLSNKQAAHRCCNRDKSDQVDEEQSAATGTTFVTTRTW